MTFLEDAVDHDIKRGMFHAHAIKTFADGRVSLRNDGHCRNQVHHQLDSTELVSMSWKYMDERSDDLADHLSEAGWIFDGKSIIIETGENVRLRKTDPFSSPLRIDTDYTRAMSATAESV
eukprot:CAMPEP_0197238018 /NCGR_PEP_ID=MMETSP1429-20130617/4659_1 /TAXON_ID=49237 /ORGANISM="Chaetoceros  sp., Strain UNC1202" /LENGTH=119 /DNA_ID=CAMNT_0042697111 /DNA_START=33 /DNA_END=390 /DNA_ORIENTATION=-